MPDAGDTTTLRLHGERERLRIAARDSIKARVVELRYFVGLNIEETAKALEVSEATVSRHWTAARLWLRRELTTA